MKLRLALLCALAVSACDQPAEEPVAVETETAQTIFAPDEPRLDETLPGAGSEYAYADLLALEPDDGVVIADSTKGAGFCTFTDEGGRVILSAGAPTEEEKAGAAVVRPNGQPATALYAQAGGSEYITTGPIFEREAVDGALGMTVTIVKADDTGAATLTFDVADGERDPYNGTWSCQA